MQALFEEWKLPIWPTVALLTTALLYMRGWIAIRKMKPYRFGTLRLTLFLLGLVVLWLAIASLLDKFANALLSAHMVEHLLIMAICPPLLLLGESVVPLLRGIPTLIRRFTVNPLLRTPAIPKMGTGL